MKEKFITDTLKTRISTNLNELRATKRQGRSVYQSNGRARHCGKNPDKSWVEMENVCPCTD